MRRHGRAAGNRRGRGPPLPRAPRPRAATPSAPSGSAAVERASTAHRAELTRRRAAPRQRRGAPARARRGAPRAGRARPRAARRAHLDPDTYVSRGEPRGGAAGRRRRRRPRARGGARRAARGLRRRAAARPPRRGATARWASACSTTSRSRRARCASAEDGVERVLILDWDVHHGNGTQHSFDDDPSRPLRLDAPVSRSTRAPARPTRSGIGDGAGYTLNMPLPAGCGDAEYVGAPSQRVLVPVARRSARSSFWCRAASTRTATIRSRRCTVDRAQGFAALARRSCARSPTSVPAARLACGARGRLRASGLCARARDALLARARRGDAAAARRRGRRCRAEACSRPWWHAWPRCTARAIPVWAPPDRPKRRSRPKVARSIS